MSLRSCWFIEQGNPLRLTHICAYGIFPRFLSFFFLNHFLSVCRIFFNHYFRKCIPATGLLISRHLRRSWCSLHSWRIFSLGIDYMWVISSFFSTLENCCNCSFWPPWFLMRNCCLSFFPPIVKIWGLRDWRFFWSSVFSYLVVICLSVDSLSLFCLY